MLRLQSPKMGGLVVRVIAKSTLVKFWSQPGFDILNASDENSATIQEFVINSLSRIFEQPMHVWIAQWPIRLCYAGILNTGRVDG